MSVLDQLHDAEQRVLQRLEELKPAVAEYRELEQAAQRLGLDPTAGGSAAGRDETAAGPTPAFCAPLATRATAKAPAPSAPARSSRGTAAPGGQRADQLLALVRRRSGVTVKNAGAELGVDPTSLHRVVRRLEQDGTLRKNGRNLEPAET